MLKSVDGIWKDAMGLGRNQTQVSEEQLGILHPRQDDNPSTRRYVKWCVVAFALFLTMLVLLSVGSSQVASLDGKVSKVALPSSAGQSGQPFEDDDEDDDEDGEDGKENLSDKSRVRDVDLVGGENRDADVLKQLLATLGTQGPFPVIVGGIGDSGTRGVREVLRAFRVAMLAENFVNIQGDSQLFEKEYKVFDPATTEWSTRTARDLYKQGVHRARTLRYNQSNFNPKTWEWGRQFIGAMLWRTMNVSAQLRAKKDRPFKFWGMKHPRSMFILPFISSALGPDKVKFVHVFRDPKEVVSGDNQQMFLGECRRYYGRDKCSRSFEKKFEFWTDTNWDALKIAQKYLGPDSYLAVRVEDFVNGDHKCFARLAKFVGLSDEEIERDMDRAVASTASHKGSYFGKHVNLMTRDQLYESIRIAPARVPNFMSMLGYSVNTFQLLKSCEDLPRV